MCRKRLYDGMGCTKFIFPKEIHDISAYVAKPSFRCNEMKNYRYIEGNIKKIRAERGIEPTREK